MYDERVCAWGADWGRTSRCFSLGAVHFAFFWLLPVSLFCGRVSAATLFFAPTPPSPTSSTPLLLFFPLSSFPSLFFFLPPLPPLSLLRPLDVCQAQLCWPSTLCVSLARRLLSFIHPSPPKPTSPSPCAPVYSRSPGLESIVVDHI